MFRWEKTVPITWSDEKPILLHCPGRGSNSRPPAHRSFKHGQGVPRPWPFGHGGGSDVAHSTRVSPLSFRWPRLKHSVALYDVFVCPQTFAVKSPITILYCVVCFIFQDIINGVVEVVCLFIWMICRWRTWTIFSWFLSVMRRTSSATLEFPEDTLVMLSFHFLFTRKPTPACPL